MGLFKPKLRKDIQHKINTLNPEVFITVPHTAGLPIPENTLCQIYYCKEKMEIDGNGISFEVPISRIQNISIKTDVEISRENVSSAGGAVVGAIMFGVVGALIGGRTKTKTSREIFQYLIVTYIGEFGDIKYIGFDITYTPNGRHIAEYHAKNHAGERKVIL